MRFSSWTTECESTQNILKLFRKVLFQVTYIEFDFTTDDGEYELQPSRQEQIIDETIGQIWEADDEEDLVEEITCATGWCVNSIEFVNISR